jgi:hypothetical protein
MALADSAGTPWEGRHFEENRSADDDGSADPRLLEALRRFRIRELGEAEVVAAARDARFLVPLLAHLGEAGENEHGVLIDKTQELAIVTVTAPDARTVLPVFTSVETMSRWNPQARPVPVDAVRIALAAASEQTDLVVIDATSDTEFVMRRPALWALAQSTAWLPCYADPEVLDAFTSAARGEASVSSVSLASGDPDARLAGPELVVRLGLTPGLSRAELDGVLARLQSAWSASDVIAERVDSLRVQLVASD